MHFVHDNGKNQNQICRSEFLVSLIVYQPIVAIYINVGLQLNHNSHLMHVQARN